MPLGITAHSAMTTLYFEQSTGWSSSINHWSHKLQFSLFNKCSQKMHAVEILVLICIWQIHKFVLYVGIRLHNNWPECYPFPVFQVLQLVWPVSGVAEAMLSTYFTPWSVEVYLPRRARAGMTAEVYIRRWLATYLWGERRLSQKVNRGCQEVSWSAKQECLDRHRVGFLQPYTWYQLKYRLVNSSTSEWTTSCTLSKL